MKLSCLQGWHDISHWMLRKDFFTSQLAPMQKQAGYLFKIEVVAVESALFTQWDMQVIETLYTSLIFSSLASITFYIK
jgi:hypothetical protein